MFCEVKYGSNGVTKVENAHHRILILVADDYQDLELHYTKYRLIEAGVDVVIAGPKKDLIYKGRHGYPCKADLVFDEVSAHHFTGLVIPGGGAPDILRAIPKVLSITQDFHRQVKLIAFICHAAWVPISAKIMNGIKCTSYISIKDDVVNAGGNWVDAPVVVDQHFISSRSPDDLPKFCPAIIKFLSEL